MNDTVKMQDGKIVEIIPFVPDTKDIDERFKQRQEYLAWKKKQQ